MIQTIAIRDFQSLADEVLELGPLTVLVGASNSGKSAVRRALEGVLRNDAATGKVRVGAKTLGVSVGTEAGHVHWEKGAGANRYTVDQHPSSPLVIDKPGSTIPEAAADILRIDPDLSITNQFDAPYMLQESPSTVARTLGDLTNISVLYDGIREASRLKGASAKEAKTIEAMATEMAEKLAHYAWLADEGPALHVAAQCLGDAAEADAYYRRAAEDYGTALRLQDEFLAAREAVEHMADTQVAEQALAAAEELLGAMNAWAAVAQEANGLAMVVEAKGLEIAYIGDLDAATAAIDAAHDAVAAYGGIQRAHEEALATYAAMDAAGASLGSVHAALASLEAEMATFDTCPLCGQPMEVSP